MKFVLGTLAAAAFVGVTFVQPAEARCYWNGFETVCVRHHHFPFRYGYSRYYGGGYVRPNWWGGY